ncbi:MAG: tRNA1(Val) (adenine(37)-N6)-methyltransferase [Chitinophagaceae bacterium]
MGNPFFNFKAFTINQEHTSMKVCTDSCLFGAWVAKRMTDHFPDAGEALDVGTGTGLLSLMIAQHHPAEIHALDIEEGAIRDAKMNFEHSPWKQRLVLHHRSIQQFAKESPGTFDIVICNPPFFHLSLRSNDAGKNISKHEENLPIPELLFHINMVLKDDGAAFILLPASRHEEFLKTFEKENFYLHEIMEMKQSTDSENFRTCYRISKAIPKNKTLSTISIRDNSGNYTEEFIALLKPYYLKL